MFQTEKDKRFDVSKHVLHIHYSEKSMEERRERLKLTAALSLKSLECCNLVCKEPLAVAYKKRSKFDGSSVSDSVGPVSLTSPEGKHAFCRTFEKKKEMYGKARIAVGGRTPNVDSAMARELKRENNDIEPCFFFALGSCTSTTSSASGHTASGT